MAEVKHSTRKHALLSASGATRWLNCTPSARLEEKYEESNPSKSSIYAEEGTLAHEISDVEIRFALGKISQNVYTQESKRLQSSPLFNEDEMPEEVEKYTSYVLEQFAVIKKKHPDAVILVEQRLDFSHIVEKGFGTGDIVIIADGTIYVIDLKYGKGVKVDAKDNDQLKLYGLGALREFELLYDIHTVELVVAQIRLDHISTWQISVADLELWGSRTVKPLAAQAYLGEGTQKAGDHCRWCKVKGMCATLAAANVKLAQHDFRDPHLLSDKQIMDVYNQIPMLTTWAAAVAEHMLDTGLAGKEWKGFKIVEGQSRRKWKDEDAVMDILRKNKFLKKDYTQTKLIGIPAAEKLVGKKNLQPLLGDQIVIPQGKPTLVPESDKRPAMGVEQAKIDFAQ